MIDRYYIRLNQSLFLVRRSISLSLFLVSLSLRYSALPSLPVLAASYFFSRGVCLVMLLLVNLDLLFLPFGYLALLLYVAFMALILEVLRRFLEIAVRKRLPALI